MTDTYYHTPQMAESGWHLCIAKIVRDGESVFCDRRMDNPIHDPVATKVRTAIAGHLVSVTYLPEWMQVPALGRNMAPLIDALTEAVLVKLREDEPL